MKTGKQELFSTSKHFALGPICFEIQSDSINLQNFLGEHLALPPITWAEHIHWEIN